MTDPEQILDPRTHPSITRDGPDVMPAQSTATFPSNVVNLSRPGPVTQEQVSQLQEQVSKLSHQVSTLTDLLLGQLMKEAQ